MIKASLIIFFLLIFGGLFTAHGGILIMNGLTHEMQLTPEENSEEALKFKTTQTNRKQLNFTRLIISSMQRVKVNTMNREATQGQTATGSMSILFLSPWGPKKHVS